MRPHNPNPRDLTLRRKPETRNAICEAAAELGAPHLFLRILRPHICSSSPSVFVVPSWAAPSSGAAAKRAGGPKSLKGQQLPHCRRSGERRRQHRLRAQRLVAAGHSTKEE